ncbi:hypothetical protein OMR07_05630 [Methylobacterium organophilum]|nr:hypothetical protein [Methylobacterium organophilum]
MDSDLQRLMTNVLGDGARPTARLRVYIASDGAFLQQMWQGPVGETWANVPVHFAAGAVDADVTKSGLCTIAMVANSAMTSGR